MNKVLSDVGRAMSILCGETFPFRDALSNEQV
jgi:hypothetical protein